MIPNSNLTKPQYDSYCFSNIPPTVKYLLTGQGSPALPESVFGNLPRRYDTVILFYVDAFGWRFFEQFKDHPLLQYLAGEGVVSRLTTQFPSTTAAHVTCIHMGLTPGQSGIFEWQYYEPKLDAVITPLLFSFAGTRQRDTLKATGIEPATIYPSGTIYQDLQQHGVTSYVLQHREFTPSTYSNIMFQGAEITPYQTLSEAFVNMRELLARRQTPAYFFLYFDHIDGICHKYGPGSPQAEAEIDTFLSIMDRLFQQKLQGQLDNTLLMVTADHGHIDIDPRQTVYLNRDPRFSGLERFLKTDRQGNILVPGGAPRDVFLYIKEGMVDAAQAFLSERLAGLAGVYRVEDLIQQGFFGPGPISDTFRARAGDLLILPDRHQSVWWYEKGKFEQLYSGYHGGLSPEEMEIPLLLYHFQA
jgi:predicted AlkP superfamily pyrophosphatase or phosphodiesterase